jgi:hypothetical protein
MTAADLSVPRNHRYGEQVPAGVRASARHAASVSTRRTRLVQMSEAFVHFLPVAVCGTNACAWRTAAVASFQEAGQLLLVKPNRIALRANPAARSCLQNSSETHRRCAARATSRRALVIRIRSDLPA